MTAGETAQQRDLATPEHLPPSHSDPPGWVPQTQRTVFWIRASLITEAQRGRGRGRERQGLKGERGEIGGKEGARKGCEPALPPVSISDPSILPFIFSLHPVPPPPSQQLASFYPSRERPLWWRRLRHQCVFELRTECLSKLSMNSHPLSPHSFPHIVLHVLPSLLSSPLPRLFFILQLFPSLPAISPASTSFNHPLTFPSHSPLSPSLIQAVTPVSCLFGLAFQSSFNWTGVTCSWDDRSSPSGEVDMYRYGGLPTPTGLHRVNSGWLQAIRSKGHFKGDFLL